MVVGGHFEYTYVLYFVCSQAPEVSTIKGVGKPMPRNGGEYVPVGFCLLPFPWLSDNKATSPCSTPLKSVQKQDMAVGQNQWNTILGPF